MEKEKKDNKTTFLGFDPVETPEEIIDSDKDVKRKEAFRETHKRIAKIIPEYFMTQNKRRKNSTSGGTAFSQSIIVTPENATVQTNEVKQVESEKQEKGKERED